MKSVISKEEEKLFGITKKVTKFRGKNVGCM